ncbi:MAG: hypothetical protein WDM80_03190 [Limisphaerales bacterium]
MKKIIPIVVILAAGIAVGIYFQKQPKSQELETNAKKDVEQAGADVKTGMQKVGDAAADVKTDIKTGVEKTKDIATNIADQVKAGAQKVGEITTNVVGEIKGKLP